LVNQPAPEILHKRETAPTNMRNPTATGFDIVLHGEYNQNFDY
jgi:hypothetical protein